MGRDKVTLFTSAGISDLGAWLEQLIAESSGKEGKGLIPVDREAIGASGRLWQRSSFRRMCGWTAAPMRNRTRMSTRWKKPDSPWCALRVADKYDLGQEFFRWEIAIAVACSIIGITRSTSRTWKPARSKRAS